MYKDKVSGPDGFNSAFYKKFWGSIGPDVIANCKRWLETWVFPQGLNNTNVVLIPKCDQPQMVRDLRPISLCNVVYKILCNKLKKVLPGFIDEYQSPFQFGRSI